MAEEDEGGRGGSVWMIVGVTLIVLTLIGGAGLICLVGGVGVGVVALRPTPGPPIPVTTSGAPSAPSVGTPAPPVAPPVAPPAVVQTSGLPGVSDIPTLEPDRWHTIQSDLPTPLQAFDGFAGVPWALELARAWSPDAELHRMYLSDVKLDGTLDLVNDTDADADYRFYSPRLAVLGVRAKEVSDETVWSGFRVWVSEGEVRVMITDSTFTNPPMKNGQIDPALQTFQGFKAGCTPADLIRLARTQGGHDKRPKYDMFLRDNRTRPFSISLTPGGTYDPTTCRPR